MVKPRTIHAYLLLALAFVLGTVSGGAVVYAFVQRQQVALLDDGGRELLKERRLHALMRKLDLNEEQQAKIAAIFERSRAVEAALDRDLISRCGEPLREHRAKIDGEVRAVLHADQLERYDALLERRRERKGKHRPN